MLSASTGLAYVRGSSTDAVNIKNERATEPEISTSNNLGAVEEVGYGIKHTTKLQSHYGGTSRSPHYVATYTYGITRKLQLFYGFLWRRVQLVCRSMDYEYFVRD